MLDLYARIANALREAVTRNERLIYTVVARLLAAACMGVAIWHLLRLIF